MTHYRRWLLASLLLVILPVAAACGGDDDDDPPPPATNPATATVPVATATATQTGQAVQAETAPVLPVSVTDKDGKTVTITDVSRLVVLNGDLAEVVYALGLGEQVVGLDISATYPPEAKAKQNLGYQRALNAEGILALNPTLVLGNEVAGPPEVIAQVAAAGVTTLILPDVKTLDGVETKITTVARALGVPNRGKLLWDETKAEIDAAMDLLAKATSRPRVAFLYLRGPQTQLLAGKGSRADIMIEAAGGKDVGTDVGITGTAPITAEAIVSAAPDIILVLTAGLQASGGIDGLLRIPGLADTPAGQARRVIDFDDQYLIGLGPRTGQALMDLVKALHPELQ